MTSETLVIFDCDGVLIDSEVIVNGVHAKALTGLGMPTTLEEALEMYCGMREREMLEKIERTWRKTYRQHMPRRLRRVSKPLMRLP